MQGCFELALFKSRALSCNESVSGSIKSLHSRRLVHIMLTLDCKFLREEKLLVFLVAKEQEAEAV